VCASKGAGEILITSVDREGTRRGFDLDLIRHVSQAVNIPVIASGGMGRFADLIEAVNIGGADAVAMADYIHYEKSDFKTMRAEAFKSGLSVRLDD
jgi:cyclase